MEVEGWGVWISLVWVFALLRLPFSLLVGRWGRWREREGVEVEQYLHHSSEHGNDKYNTMSRIIGTKRTLDVHDVAATDESIAPLSFPVLLPNLSRTEVVASHVSKQRPSWLLRDPRHLLQSQSKSAIHSDTCS